MENEIDRLKRIKDSAQKYYVAVTSTKYKYIIGHGNNSELVKRVMKTRACWINLQFPNNFKWQPVSKGINFDKLPTNDKTQSNS